LSGGCLPFMRFILMHPIQEIGPSLLSRDCLDEEPKCIEIEIAGYFSVFGVSHQD
jgi:hypothetical protein